MMLCLRCVVLPSVFALSVACGGSSQPATPPGPTPAVEVAPAGSPEAEHHYLQALDLEAAGRHEEARAEVELAIAGGSGRDAKLLAAKLAILRDDLDEATRLLEPLSKDAGDALVLYNLGLVAQKRNRYNSARSRYLAALKADPNYNPARFNLAVLTWEAGVKDEAEHHARKYIELAPDDPHAAKLKGLILEPAPPVARTPPPAEPATPAPAPAPVPEPARKR